MKLSLLPSALFLLLLGLFTHGQVNQKENIQIRYTQIIDFGQPVPTEYVLTIDNTYSYYEEVVVNRTKGSKMTTENQQEGLQVNYYVQRKNLNPEFYFNDGKDFYFKSIFYDKEFLVRDNFGSIDWIIVDDFQLIEEFKCQKATTRFRGRNYTAWFTSEIPTKFGPWKFHDLPGLILQIQDEDAHFQIRATSINFQPKIDQKQPHPNNHLENHIELEEYLNIKDELINEEFRKISARLPKGFGVPQINRSCSDCRKEVEIF